MTRTMTALQRLQEAAVLIEGSEDSAERGTILASLMPYTEDLAHLYRTNLAAFESAALRIKGIRGMGRQMTDWLRPIKDAAKAQGAALDDATIETDGHGETPARVSVLRSGNDAVPGEASGAGALLDALLEARARAAQAVHLGPARDARLDPVLVGVARDVLLEARHELGIEVACEVRGDGARHDVHHPDRVLLELEPGAVARGVEWAVARAIETASAVASTPAHPLPTRRAHGAPQQKY